MTKKISFQLVPCLCFVLVLIGIVLRVRELIVFRPLWMDEASLAFNIVFRSFTDLTLALERNQACPVAVLLFQKIMITVFGVQDGVLRVLPFVSGIAVLCIVWRIVNAYAGRWSGVLVLALTAFSYRLVYYSVEIKQYATDIVVFLCIFLMVDVYTRAKVSGRMFVRLYLVGAFALLCSHPAAFALAALGIVCMVVAIRAHDRRRMIWLLVIGGLWAIEVALSYMCWFRHVAGAPYMQTFWAHDFMPSALSRVPAWFAAGWSMIMREWVLLPVGIGSVLIAAGLGMLWRRSMYAALFMVLVFVSMLAVSRFGLYPFSGRLSMFMFPVIYLLAAEGVRWGGLVFARIHRVSGVIVVCVLTVAVVWTPVVSAYHNFRHPHRPGNDVRSVVSYLARHVEPDSVFYVHPLLREAFMIYARSSSFEPGRCVIGEYGEGADAMVRSIRTMTAFPLVWFVLPGIQGAGGGAEAVFFPDSINVPMLQRLVMQGRAIDAVVLDRLNVDRTQGSSAVLEQVSERQEVDCIDALNEVLAMRDLYEHVHGDGLTDMLTAHDRAVLARVREARERGVDVDDDRVRVLNNALLQIAYPGTLYGFQWGTGSCLRYLDSVGKRLDAYVLPNGAAVYLYSFAVEEVSGG